MFGFGNKNDDSIRKTANRAAIHNTFGSTDVDNVLKEYMPELSKAILNASDAASANNKTLGNICQGLGTYHNELLEQFTELKQQNIELQKKYDAMLERMDKILAREEGKGR